jgi:uncharacterized protein with NAD-binding domain and iron-sulfur cluster
MTAMMPEIARPEGRIHFAGEHTSSWMGWMEGALLSGERAAQEVIAAMGAAAGLGERLGARRNNPATRSAAKNPP